MKKREEKEINFQPYFFGSSERREYFSSEEKKIKNIISFSMKKAILSWKNIYENFNFEKLPS